jgi:putative DNA primase/helicase
LLESSIDGHAKAPAARTPIRTARARKDLIVVYQQTQSPGTLSLSGEHFESLTLGSGISEEVVETRGYWTATDPDELAGLGFAKYQCRVPALVIPVRGVEGEVLFSRIRPDDPRQDKRKPEKVVKYEQPSGTPVALDVPPPAQEGLLDRSKRLWIVEGEKKADALVSRDEVAIALLGVWNWKKDERMLLDWESIPLMDRDVIIAFDSDAVQNYQVRLAEDALAKALEARGGFVG